MATNLKSSKGGRDWSCGQERKTEGRRGEERGGEENE
jgi:hypothetical protein